MSEGKAHTMDWNAVVTGTVGGLSLVGAAVGALMIRWVSRIEQRIDLNEQRIWDLKEQVPTKEDMGKLEARFHSEFRDMKRLLEMLVQNTTRAPSRHTDHEGDR